MATNDFRYAGLGPRFVALAIDLFALSLVFFPVTRLVKGTWLMTGAEHRWNYGLLVTDPLCLAFLAVIVIYFVVMEAWAGGTVGKLLTGIRVVDREGNLPGFTRSLVRNLLRVVDALPVMNAAGIWLILQSSECARFGDRVAGTRVVLLADRK